MIQYDVCQRCIRPIRLYDISFLQASSTTFDRNLSCVSLFIQTWSSVCLQVHVRLVVPSSRFDGVALGIHLMGWLRNLCAIQELPSQAVEDTAFAKSNSKKSTCTGSSRKEQRLSRSFEASTFFKVVVFARGIVSHVFCESFLCPQVSVPWLVDRCSAAACSPAVLL